jgi:RecB family exonuclease
VFSVATLHLHATAEAAEERWRAALDDGAAVELGLGHATLAQLVAAADAPEGTKLGALGELLIVDAVAEEIGGALGRIARSRGLRRSLRRTFSSLRRVGVTARELGDAGAPRELSRAYAGYLRFVGAAFDEGEAWRRGCERLAAGAPVRALAGVDGVETHGIVAWDGALLLALDALLARGTAVRVNLPWDERAPLARALAPSLAALESRHAAPLEVVRAPLPPLRARPTFVSAATPFVEAREIARRVRDLVDAGVAPEAIAVCAATESRRAHLGEALVRYGVPVGERRRGVAAAAPPVRIALSLLQLADERIGRERLIALLGSRYVAGGEPGLPAHRIARALREAGVIDADLWEAPLAAWAAQKPSRAAEVERIRARVGALVATVRSLPREGTIVDQTTALRRALERLELFARARGFAGDGQGTVEETRALARDQAAVRALERVLDDLARAAARVGFKKAVLPRARFARLLEEALAGESLRATGVRGAAVEVGELQPDRAIEHLFVCGLVDGELPPRAPEDPLLSDEERARINRALGRPALPLAGAVEDLGALAFARALAGAAHVTLSWTRADEEGAPQLRSPLVDELQPKDREIALVSRDPLPRVAEARSLDELTARVALEVRGDRGSRLSLPDREGSTELYRLLAARAPARLARLEHLAAVERQRERFFADDEAAPHPFVGALGDEALLAALAGKLPGREERPLSASAVESYAACRFQFFLRHVLDAAPVEEVDEELDPFAAGRLHHRVLERLFRRLSEEGRFPLSGDAAEHAVAAAACDEALAEWRRSNPIGHPGLFAVWERRLRRQIDALLDAERERPPAPGCTPARFESRFGPLPVLAPDGDERIYLHGLIDRVDLGPNRAVVLDYKAGGKKRNAQHVKDDELLVSAWQLPIYAAAARAELGAGHHIEARFYSLRDVETTEAMIGDDRVALDELGRQRARAEGRPNVGDALWALHRAMRAGDFVVRPREDACERCHMEAACRVMRLPEDEEIFE